MDISKVRRRFQTLWNFNILTNASLDLSQAHYSLQQGSLNTSNMLLYVTFNSQPPIEGHVLEAENQKWIVYLGMKEVFNNNLYQFRLYPVTNTVSLKPISIGTNDLGMVPTSDQTTAIVLDCYVDEFSKKEKPSPTAQPVEAFQQTFIVAKEQLPDYRGAYELFYKDIKYKIDSFEISSGIIKIRATQDL